MGIAFIAPALMLPVCIVAWKHGIQGEARTLIQGLLVVFAAIMASGAYLDLRVRLEREPTFFDKFWIALPSLASFVVTGRCIFGRLVQLVVRSRRRSQTMNGGS